MKKLLFVAIIALGWAACQSGDSGNKTQQTPNKQVDVPKFSADSAFAYVEAQLNFGPRVPNTPAHVACGDYLIASLDSFGAKVQVQAANLQAYDGTRLRARNIMGSFRPEVKRRILLMAHWDTRPVADQCEDKSRQKEPIPGANDGASGVAVLMEVARLLGQQLPDVGVDILFFDAEDYGAPTWAESRTVDDWCLGSQYWAEEAKKSGYYAQYGILLDMVGAPAAQFGREAISMHYAEPVVNKVWDAANMLGYSSYFVYDKTPQIIDDHMFVNQIAGIPTIDIIHHDNSSDHYFGAYWHTHNDNLQAIDKATLKAVGQTLLQVVYYE